MNLSSMNSASMNLPSDHLTPRLIALTGGIGCGKSLVSRLLRMNHYAVYDCDREARRLMEHDPELCAQLVTLFGPETYEADGRLNRRHLADRIFGNESALAAMNAAVHPCVERDLMRWRTGQSGRLIFFESAILFECGFDRLADEVWSVSAPRELRIERTVVRDHTTRVAVEARMESQWPQEEKDRRATRVLYNIPTRSIIAQVHEALAAALTD
jgi:dephospho-CoA kinase